MSGNAYPAALRRVITAMSKLPGVGEKTAGRLAMHLLRAPGAEVLELAQALTGTEGQDQALPALLRLCGAGALPHLRRSLAPPGPDHGGGGARRSAGPGAGGLV